MWLTMHNKILTKDNLTFRGWIQETKHVNFAMNKKALIIFFLHVQLSNKFGFGWDYVFMGAMSRHS